MYRPYNVKHVRILSVTASLTILKGFPGSMERICKREANKSNYNKKKYVMHLVNSETVGTEN